MKRQRNRLDIRYMQISDRGLPHEQLKELTNVSPESVSNLHGFIGRGSLDAW